MKLAKRIFGISLLFMLFTNSILYAQLTNDSSFVASVSQNITTLYLNQLQSGSPIYNGKKYIPEIGLEEGHSLFINDKYSTGTIIYDGYTFKDLLLMYDLIHQQLVLLNFDKVGGIIVQDNHVSSFSVHNHTFINIQPSETEQKGIASGYYDLLYNGTVKLLARRTKRILESTAQANVIRTVEQSDKYYLLKEQEYIPINGKKALLKQLKETNSQNLQYIKKQRLNFRTNKEASLIALLEFYGSIAK